MVATGKIALIIEPDEESAIVMARQLARLGLDSLTASGIESAVDTLRWLDPDIVLMNQQFRAENGVKRVACRADKRAPLVVVGEGRDASAIGTAIWQGASECLMRPFDDDILQFKLQQTGVL